MRSRAFAVVLLALHAVGLASAQMCPRDYKLVCDDPCYPDCYCVHSPRTAPPTRRETAHTGSQTPTETPAPLGCVGDCDRDGEVRINELVTGVGIALGTIEASSCSEFACPSQDGEMGIACLVMAVGNALGGCESLPAPSATPTPPVTVPAASPTVTTPTPPKTPTVTPLAGIDLRPSEVIGRGEYQSGCRGPLAYLSVCIENVGSTASGPFSVIVQPGNDRFEVPDVGAQDRICADRPFTGWEEGGYHTFDVTVDVGNRVAEVDEVNNALTVQVLRPTIPVTCSPSGTPTRTPAPGTLA